ncbi:MAG: hypothetical protein KDB65_03475 [Calditrichaeota bacterium]|nr:hypothetical protein [Calditrichota bacterium]MCB9368723.1 hypothetical protein [Calditrichota bacterium]
MDEIRTRRLEDERPITREQSNRLVPVNRRKDGMLFRVIAERIKTGYYESTQVLKEIADRIAGTK